MSFSTRRNTELSMVEYITTLINGSWNNVAVVKSFLKAYEAPVPVIAVRLLDVQSSRQEIGSNRLKQVYTFIIDVFANSDGQRIDLAEFLVQGVKEGCIYYEFSHNSANRELLDKDANGRLIFLQFLTDERVDINATAAEHDKFRHSITFTCE